MKGFAGCLQPRTNKKGQPFTAGPFRAGNAHGIITGQIRHKGRD